MEPCQTNGGTPSSGPRRGGEPGQGGPELALPVHDVLAPQAVEEGVVLVGERDPVAEVLAEPRVDRAHVAATHHQVDPAVGQVLEHRVVLGDLDRVVGRDQGRRRREDQAIRLRGDVAEHRGGGGRHEGRVVVLAGGEHVQPDLLGLERDGDHRLDPRFLARCRPGGWVGGDIADREDPELHLVFILDGGCAVPCASGLAGPFVYDPTLLDGRCVVNDWMDVDVAAERREGGAEARTDTGLAPVGATRRSTRRLVPDSASWSSPAIRQEGAGRRRDVALHQRASRRVTMTVSRYSLGTTIVPSSAG